MKRTMRWVALAAVVALIAAVAAAGGFVAGSDEAEAQAVPPPSSMQDRLDQFILELGLGNCEAIRGGLLMLPATLWGGLRILPTLGVPESMDAHDAISTAERQAAQALEGFINSTTPCFEGEREGAFSAKLATEMLNEMAHALGAITAQCGVGSDLTTSPCSQLARRVITFTGLERDTRQTTIESGYTVLVRSPLGLLSFGTTPHRATLEAPGLRSKECSSMVLESGSIAVRLHLQPLSAVSYPWLTTFNVAVETETPVWTMEVLPVEYIKQLDVCNQAGTIERTITTDIIADDDMAWLWQYTP